MVFAELALNSLLGIFNSRVLFLLDHMLYIAVIVCSLIATDMLSFEFNWGI